MVYKCEKCGEEFNTPIEVREVSMHVKNYWSPEEQLKFHEENKCAIFNFRNINYQFFITEKNILIPYFS